MVVLLTSAMSLIRDDPSYLLAGLLLLGFTAACNDLASVPYNAMLRQLTTPDTSGRVSGFGWAAGYIGSRCCFLWSTRDSSRATDRRSGCWTSRPPAARTFARPCWSPPPGWPRSRCRCSSHRRRPRISSRRCGRRPVCSAPTASCGRIWSASGGGTDMSSTTCSPARCSGTDWPACSRSARCSASSSTASPRPNVLLFGITANVVAAAGAVLGGLLDDRVGSKAVILGSLAAMIAVGLTLMALSGAVAFWVVRAAAVPVHRADAGVGAHAAAADDRPWQGGRGVRALHHDGPGRGAPRAVHVLDVHRRLRRGPCGHRGSYCWCWQRVSSRCLRCGCPAGRRRSNGPRCRSSALRRCAAAPAHR